MCRYSDHRRGFTLVELLVVVGIVAVLMAILLTTASKIRESANATKCLSNLRQIGCAISNYAIDHHGCLVPGDYVGVIDGFGLSGAGNWADILVDGGYITAPTGAYPPDKLYADFGDDVEHRDTILRCPDGTDGNAAESFPTSQNDPRGAFYFVRGSDATHEAVFTWYAINCTPHVTPSADAFAKRTPFNFLPDYAAGRADWHINRLSRIPARVPLVFDGVWCLNDDPDRISARHGSRHYTNLLFADGSSRALLTTMLPNQDWYVKQ
jgi:prepilin-type N-terminal cleavage/methylation domain-containing protein/prepilin-type processing-associated H-X9-DG protein